MRKILCLVICLLFTGCGAKEQATERAPAGVIGADIPISREMAAKTIALAFYTNAELAELEMKLDFSDISSEDWAYPYLCGCVEQGFFVGSEEGTFRPADALTLWEAQTLMDRLAPNYDSRMVLTEENETRAVSYELWVQLLETALKARRGEDSLYSYGIRQKNAVLLSAEGLCDIGKFTADGIDLSPYLFSRITFLEKEGEILALQTVEAASPVLKNIFCRKEDGNLLLETGEGAAEIPFSGRCEPGMYDVKLEKGRAVEVTPAASLGQCVVKRVSSEEILLEGKGILKWAEDARIYDVREDVTLADFSDFICGTAGAEFFERAGEICGAVIRGNVVPENIRIFLKGTEQEKVTLSAEKGFTLSNEKTKKKFKAGKKAVLTADLAWFDYGILRAESESPICIAYTDGTSYAYEGVLELERRGENRFSIVNELPLERYLLGVVPNEMPISFGQTALEAQAIAARSFAYNQFYGNAYCGYGAHVVDTTASQVYLGYEENEVAEAAVKATEGQCAVTADGAVAQTYFYSTSCGFGAGSEEVWSADGSFSGKGKSYLQAQKYGGFQLPETEEEWLSFWQDWEQKGHDDTSPWYRWKVYFSCRQLTEILGQKLAEISIKNRQVVLLQHDNGGFLPYQKQDMGLLQGMRVERRGEGGIVMELHLNFEKGKVVVKTENIIRKILSPTRISVGEPIYLQRKNGDSLTGQNMLPSGFFAVKEMKNEKGELTGIALYGGGNGHGVGMSQYGAKGLAVAGKTAEEIIKYYFPGTTVEQVL